LISISPALHQLSASDGAQLSIKPKLPPFAGQGATGDLRVADASLKKS
jgi:hypothetical protein